MLKVKKWKKKKGTFDIFASVFNGANSLHHDLFKAHSLSFAVVFTIFYMNAQM